MTINIYELCAKPPEELTDEDIARTVARLREMRAEYSTAQAKGERVGKQAATLDEVSTLFSDL